jgi:hypothetical protein
MLKPVNWKGLRAPAWLAALGLLMLSSPARAQSPSPFAVETNLHGVYAYTQPPAGFNPVTAPAADLELYGYPARPAANESAKASARWATIVNPKLRRIVPELLRTNIYHRPAAGLVIQNSGKDTYSLNWSGYVLVHNKHSFDSVAGAWIVPTAQAFICSGVMGYSAQWVGIDGWPNSISGNILQAGSEADASCVNNTTTTDYYPWIEWYTGREFKLAQQNGDPLPFAPGDYLIVTVTATDWFDGASENGALNFTDVTQNWQISETFSAASLGGEFVTGQSAEWILERPLVNDAFPPLANYVADPWFEADATDLKKIVHLPGAPKGATSYNVTMTGASSVDLFGTDVLWFFPVP